MHLLYSCARGIALERKTPGRNDRNVISSCLADRNQIRHRGVPREATQRSLLSGCAWFLSVLLLPVASRRDRARALFLVAHIARTPEPEYPGSRVALPVGLYG